MATYYVDGAVGNDTNAGTSAGAGNAWATVSHGVATMSGGDTLNVKATVTYTITGTMTPPAGSAGLPTIIQGYTTTVGDGGQATIQISSGSFFMFTLSANFLRVQNFILDCNLKASTRGIQATGNELISDRITVMKFTDYGHVYSGTNHVIHSPRATAGTNAGGGAGLYFGGAPKVRNIISDNNACVGVLCPSAPDIIGGLVLNNTGASIDGIQVTSAGASVRGLSIYGNGRDGIRYTSTGNKADGAMVTNCIFVNNGAYGVNCQDTNNGLLLANYNAFYNNPSGQYHNYSGGANDVTLTGVPFTNPPTDMSLNSGAGAACKALAFPGAMLYGGTGYLDIGALQSQAPSGGGGTRRRAF